MQQNLCSQASSFSYIQYARKGGRRRGAIYHVGVYLLSTLIPLNKRMNLLFFCLYGYCPRVVRDCGVYLHMNTKYGI